MKKLLLLLYVVLFGTLGCSDDEKRGMLISDPCLVDTSFTKVNQYPLTASPVINPNNPDEFAFIKNPYSSSCCKKSIVVYNFATKEKRIVYEGAARSINWSKKDWILFKNSADYKIYKVKSNGDSLTQLVHAGQTRLPIWNLEGDKFIYANDDLGINICSEDGTVLQTIKGDFLPKYETWHHDSLLASTNNYFPTDGHIHINTFTASEAGNGHHNRKAIIINGDGGMGCDWIDNENLIVASTNGIYKVNFSEPMEEGIVSNLLIENCNSMSYRNPCVIRQTQQVIFQRFEYEITDENKATLHIRFVRMNLDGTDEEVIEIPGL